MLTSDKIKERLTTEDIIKLCCFLQGTDRCGYDRYEHPTFNTYLCHKGDSEDKLYYYPETKLFHCYTCGKSPDIFEVVQSTLDTDFKGALDYIVKFFNLREIGFEEVESTELTDDWDIFQKIQDYAKVEKEDVTIPPIHENLLEYFYPLAAPTEWLKDGISKDVMRYYGIRVDSALHKVIIPHRNIDGELVGIRGRSYDPIEVDAGKKYMPVIIQGDIYKHSLGKNLFGLFENKDTIARIKKAFVAESEKSVLQLATMYGVENCWAVATCGSSFSKEQMNLLLDLGVEEIVLGYDREFEGGKGSEDTTQYEEKLLKTVSPLLPYVNVSVVMDYDHLTPYKASPTDCGKEIFEQLYHNRIKLYTYNEEIKKGGKKHGRI